MKPCTHPNGHKIFITQGIRPKVTKWRRYAVKTETKTCELCGETETKELDTA